MLLREAMPNPPEPVCKAILLCQQTIVEEGTKLVSLIGVFDGFKVAEGGTTGAAEIFCRLTEAQGHYRISVEIHELSNGTAIGGTNGIEIDISDRLATSNVIIPVPPLPLPPGEYDIVIFANGVEIDRQKIVVNKK